MIQKLINDLIEQLIIELKKQETFERIKNVILEPISAYVKSKTYSYINILLFVIILYSISQPLILIILFKQNNLIMNLSNSLKEVTSV
jgi:hypothetical protein